MRTVEQEQVAGSELALAPGVQEALGELASAAKWSSPGFVDT